MGCHGGWLALRMGTPRVRPGGRCHGDQREIGQNQTRGRGWCVLTGHRPPPPHEKSRWWPGGRCLGGHGGGCRRPDGRIHQRRRWPGGSCAHAHTQRIGESDGSGIRIVCALSGNGAAHGHACVLSTIAGLAGWFVDRLGLAWTYDATATPPLRRVERVTRRSKEICPIHGGVRVWHTGTNAAN